MAKKQFSKQEINEQYFEVLGKVGLIVHLSQLIEYNVANILAFDDLLDKFNDNDEMYSFEYEQFKQQAENLYKTLSIQPMGACLAKAKDVRFFTKDSYDRLRSMCDERNWAVHRLFKEDLELRHLETDPIFYFDRLENIIDDMNAINQDLIKIFENQKQEYNCIW